MGLSYSGTNHYSMEGGTCMKPAVARKLSVLLAIFATFIAAVEKPLLHSPEVPEELKK